MKIVIGYFYWYKGLTTFERWSNLLGIHFRHPNAPAWSLTSSPSQSFSGARPEPVSHALVYFNFLYEAEDEILFIFSLLVGKPRSGVCER